jgi:amino acid permease
MSAPRTLSQSSGIFRRKPIDQIEESPDTGGLRRTVGLRQLTAIGVGGIIGAGIFSLAGAVAHETAGPAVLISFLIAGIASAAAAFSYAEFAGLIPAPAPPTPTATWCSAGSSAGTCCLSTQRSSPWSPSGSPVTSMTCSDS